MRVEVLYDRLLAADHHAVAALQTPDATARADVDVVDSLGGEFLRAPDVVHVVGVAAVDEDVAASRDTAEQSAMVLSTTAAGTISQTARGFASFFTRSCQRGRPGRLLLDQLFHRLGRPVEDDAVVTRP